MAASPEPGAVHCACAGPVPAAALQGVDGSSLSLVRQGQGAAIKADLLEAMEGLWRKKSTGARLRQTVQTPM